MQTLTAWFIAILTSISSSILAQEPEDNASQGMHEGMYEGGHEAPVGEPTDIVLDYRGLIQKIDEMRQREDDILRKLEELAKSYEEGLKKLEETSKKLEEELSKFESWHDKTVDKLEAIDRAWTEPSEIKGEIRGVPSDRYTTN